MADLRLVHKSTDSLSPEAWRIMIAGFRSKMTYRAIARQIEKETGEKVSDRTIGRRGQEWRAEQARREAAREQMQSLVDAMKAGNMTAAEMIQALAVDALMQDPEAFSQADPLKVQAQNLRAEEIRLKKEELALRQRAHKLDVQKFQALQEREQRAVAETEAMKEKAERGEKLTVEDLERIRSIYGLNG